MNINGKVRMYLLSIFFLCLFSVHSFGQTTVQVKEQVTATERVMTFQNKIGKTADRVKQAETRMNNANFKGVVSVKINPQTNQVVARLKKDIRKEDLDHFFGAMGYTKYVIN